MTNGEKLKEVFPSIGLYEKAHDGIQINFNSVWFNAEYKEPTGSNNLSSELDKNSKKLENGTTKNDLAQERYQDLKEYFGDEKVAKNILESRKEFKAWLERLRWNVKRADELARELEQIKSTAKNNLGVDCIDRQATLDAIIKRLGIKNETYLLEAERAIYQQILAMPSVTPQEPRKHDIRKRLRQLQERRTSKNHTCL